MAAYLVVREREIEVRRTETAEVEIEAADDATEAEIIRAARNVRASRWNETDDWDDINDSTDSYEVVKRLDTEEPWDRQEVRGKPEDFGMTQPELFVAVIGGGG